MPVSENTCSTFQPCLLVTASSSRRWFAVVCPPVDTRKYSATRLSLLHVFRGRRGFGDLVMAQSPIGKNHNKHGLGNPRKDSLSNRRFSGGFRNTYQRSSRHLAARVQSVAGEELAHSRRSKSGSLAMLAATRRHRVKPGGDDIFACRRETTKMRDVMLDSAIVLAPILELDLPETLREALLDAIYFDERIAFPKLVRRSAQSLQPQNANLTSKLRTPVEGRLRASSSGRRS